MQPIVNSIDRFVMVIKQWVEVADEKGKRERERERKAKCQTLKAFQPHQRDE